MADDDPNNENKRKNKEEIFDLSKKMFEIEKDIAKFSNKNTIDIQKQIDLKRVSLELDRDKADLENLFNEENKKRAAAGRDLLDAAYLKAAKKLLDERAELEELSINRNATALKQQSGINYISGKIGDETKRIADNYLEIVKSTNRIGSSIKFISDIILDYFIAYEKSSAAFRKSTGLTISQSIEQQKLAVEINKQYQSFGVNLDDAFNAIKAIQDTFSGLRLETEQTTELAALLSANYGVAAENTAQTLIKFQGLGGASEDVAVNVTKSALSMAQAAKIPFAKVMEDVAKASDDVLITIGATPEKLFGAAIGARKLGVELNTIAATARRILDFNTSINDELNASALLGRSVNFQRARQLAFDNDIEGANREILRVVRSVGDFNRMNLFQREALAKASGMDLATLTKMMAVEKIRTSGNAEQKERLRLIDDQTKKLKDLSKEEGDNLLKSLEMQTAMENLNNAVKQLTASLGALVLPLIQLASAITKSMESLPGPVRGFIVLIGLLGIAYAKHALSVRLFRNGMRDVVEAVRVSGEAQSAATKSVSDNLAKNISTSKASATAQAASSTQSVSTAKSYTLLSKQARVASISVNTLTKSLVANTKALRANSVAVSSTMKGPAALAKGLGPVIVGVAKALVVALLIAVGIAALGASLIVLGKGFGALKEGIADFDVVQLLKVGAGVALFVGSLITLGALGPIAAVGLGVFATAMFGLRASLMVISDKNVEKIYKLGVGISSIVNSLTNVSSTKAGIDLIKSISDIEIGDAIVDKLSKIASLSDGLMNTAIAMERLSSAVSTLSNVNYDGININTIRKVADAGAKTTTTTGTDSSAVVKAINDLRTDLLDGKIAVYLDAVKVNSQLGSV
jgi:hypothetical protein